MTAAAAPAWRYAEPVLRIEHVGLTLGGNVILRDVDAEIRDIEATHAVKGQIVALLGPSGMGKSMLGRVLAGLQAPTTGQVLLNANREPVAKGKVGFVSQDYRLFGWRTVLSNLVVAERLTGLGRDAARTKALGLLARFGITDTARRYPCELSGGQRQRAAIAAQILCSEHFLLMDEPFSGLDVLAKDRACELIAEVANAHTLNTVIVVTHDVATAVAIADTLWLLGRDRTPAGQTVPGARIQQVIDLLERGVAWHPDVTRLPAYASVVAEVLERFRTL